MQLYIKNKFFSFRGDSYVYDEKGNHVFFVEGKLFSFSSQKTVKDMHGNVLFYVRNKYFTWLSTTYIYNSSNMLVATIKRVPFSFRHQYVVEGAKDSYLLDGSLFNFFGRLNIFKNGVPIGSIENVYFDFVDSFLLTAENEQDIAFLVALVIAHDNIHDRNSN